MVFIYSLSISVYFNSLYNKFTFDDIHIVENNSLIKEPKNIFQLFAKEYWASTSYETQDSKLYRPLIVISYLLTHTFFGGKPFWFHFGNVLFHSANVLLVFLICKYLLTFFYRQNGFNTAAFFCGLFFAVHPIHVEVVAGIVGRSELLAGFFCILAFYFYLREKIIISLLTFFRAISPAAIFSISPGTSLTLSTLTPFSCASFNNSALFRFPMLEAITAPCIA